MKYTLKDLPDSPQKRALEKELRELIKPIDDFIAEKGHGSLPSESMILYHYVKEILGESEEKP